MKSIDLVKQAIADARTSNMTLDVGDPWDISDVHVAISYLSNAIGDVSKKITEPLKPQLLQALTQEQWNLFAHTLYTDLFSLYTALNVLNSLVPLTISTDDALRRWSHVYALTREIYSDIISSNGTLQERVYSNPQLRKELVYSKSCNIDDGLPGITAKILQTEKWTHTSVSLSPASNGVSAKRYGKWEESKIDDMFDDDDSSWHEYELLNHVTEASHPLVMELNLYRSAPQEINRITLDFSIPSVDYPLVDYISVSTDGEHYETVLRDATPDSRGKVTTRFLPLNAKYVRIRVTQQSGIMKEIDNEKYIRKAILTKSIELVSEYTDMEGEIILGPFTSQDIVEHVKVDADVLGIVESYLSIGDTFRWHPFDLNRRVYVNTIAEEAIREPGAAKSLMLRLKMKIPNALYSGSLETFTTPVSGGDMRISLPKTPMEDTVKVRINAVAHYGGSYGVLLSKAAEEPNKTVKVPKWLRNVKGKITVAGTEWGIVPDLHGKSKGQVFRQNQSKGEIVFGNGEDGALPVGDVEMMIPSHELKFQAGRPYKAQLPMPSDGSKENTKIQVAGVPSYIRDYKLPRGIKQFSFGKKNVIQSKYVTVPVPQGVVQFTITEIPSTPSDLMFADKHVFSRYVPTVAEVVTDGDWTCIPSREEGLTWIYSKLSTNKENAGTVSFYSKGTYSRTTCGITTDASTVYVQRLPHVNEETGEYEAPCSGAVTKQVQGPGNTISTEYYCPLVLSNTQALVFDSPLRFGDEGEKHRKVYTAPVPALTAGTSVLIRSHATGEDSDNMETYEQRTKIAAITPMKTFAGGSVQIATFTDPLAYNFRDNRYPHILHTSSNMIGPQFNNGSVFSEEVTYVDGASEIRRHGQFSIDYDNGMGYCFDELPPNTSVSFSYSDVIELDKSEWHFTDDNNAIEISELRTGKSSMGFAVDSDTMTYMVPNLLRRTYKRVPFKPEYAANPSKRYDIGDGTSIVPETDLLRGEFIPAGVTQFTVASSYIVRGTFSVIPVFSSNICTRSRDFSVTPNSLSGNQLLGKAGTQTTIHKCSLGHSKYKPGANSSGFYEEYCADPAGRAIAGRGCRHYIPPASEVASVFKRECSFVNGISELLEPGDYSIEYDSGTVYTKSPVPEGAVVQYGGNRYTCSFVACADVDPNYVKIDGANVLISHAFADVWGVKEFANKSIVISYIPEGAGAGTKRSTKCSVIKNIKVTVGGRDE